METILYVRKEGITKNIEYDANGRAFVWYKCHGVLEKKYIDFHLMIQLFVFGHKHQWEHFPSDMRWIAGTTLLMKRSTIEDAMDELLKIWGYTLDERQATLDENHEVARLTRQLIRTHFTMLPSDQYNQWEGPVIT